MRQMQNTCRVNTNINYIHANQQRNIPLEVIMPPRVNSTTRIYNARQVDRSNFDSDIYTQTQPPSYNEVVKNEI